MVKTKTMISQLEVKSQWETVQPEDAKGPTGYLPGPLGLISHDVPLLVLRPGTPFLPTAVTASTPSSASRGSLLNSMSPPYARQENLVTAQLQPSQSSFYKTFGGCPLPAGLGTDYST